MCVYLDKGAADDTHRLEVNIHVLEVGDAVSVLVAERRVDKFDARDAVLGLGLFRVYFGLAQVSFDAVDCMQRVCDVTKPVCVYLCIRSCVRTYIHTYMHACIHTCTHTCIRAQHACIHTYNT